MNYKANYAKTDRQFGVVELQNHKHSQDTGLVSTQFKEEVIHEVGLGQKIVQQRIGCENMIKQFSKLRNNM